MTTIHEVAQPNPGTYTPGHARLKALVILYGVVLFAVGLWEITGPLHLVLTGESARAEAIAVVKMKEGLPDLVLRSDTEIQAHLETRDRSYIFWNQFQFQTRAGREVEVRAPVGCQLKPLYALLDDDGLPTTDLVYYDPAHPEVVVFPYIISTWFAPTMVMLAGLLAMLIGGVLLYWADKPIEMPHLPPRAPEGTP